jgi:hypothetical protein
MVRLDAFRKVRSGVQDLRKTSSDGRKRKQSKQAKPVSSEEQ